MGSKRAAGMRERGRSWRWMSAMSKSQHGKHVANVQRKIAGYLHKGDPVPPGLAQALAALL